LSDARLWVVYADGSSPFSLTGLPDTPRHDDLDPSWSPDGTRIAFESKQSGDLNERIYVVNADGTAPAPVTPSSGTVDQAPAWSPDGTTIAFLRYFQPSDDRFQVVLMEPNGSNERILWDGVSSLHLASPSWSPDSKNLAWSQEWENMTTHPATLYRMGVADTTEVPVYGGEFIQVQQVSWGP
jgi:Tol biopolymer transport system component